MIFLKLQGDNTLRLSYKIAQMKTIIKKVIGVILIIIGIFALLTPLTPGSWLALIGMELLGIHLVIFDRFLSEKQRAALRRYMAKLGIKSSDSQDANKAGQKTNEFYKQSGGKS
jgi:protein-S-isoprenylcysteine O-methyltransferase Ste14